MKRFLMTMTLSCALSGSALAGDIPTGGYTPPPPPPPDGLQVSPAEIPTGGITGEIPWDIAQQVEDAAYAGFLTVVGLLV